MRYLLVVDRLRSAQHPPHVIEVVDPDVVIGAARQDEDFGRAEQVAVDDILRSGDAQGVGRVGGENRRLGARDGLLQGRQRVHRRILSRDRRRNQEH